MYFDKRGLALIIYENALQYINKSLTMYFCIFFKNNEVLGTCDLSAIVYKGSEGTCGWVNDTNICVLASEYDEVSCLIKSATAYSYHSSS